MKVLTKIKLDAKLREIHRISQFEKREFKITSLELVVSVLHQNNVN